MFLTKHYAIKIPRFVEWRLFLFGLLANMQEARFWWHLHSEKLCPVVWSLHGGFCVIMPRTHPLTQEDYTALDFEQFIHDGNWVVPV